MVTDVFHPLLNDPIVLASVGLSLIILLLILRPRSKPVTIQKDAKKRQPGIIEQLRDTKPLPQGFADIMKAYAELIRAKGRRVEPYMLFKFILVGGVISIFSPEFLALLTTVAVLAITGSKLLDKTTEAAEWRTRALIAEGKVETLFPAEHQPSTLLGESRRESMVPESTSAEDLGEENGARSGG